MLTLLGTEILPAAGVCGAPSPWCANGCEGFEEIHVSRLTIITWHREGAQDQLLEHCSGLRIGVR